MAKWPLATMRIAEAAAGNKMAKARARQQFIPGQSRLAVGRKRIDSIATAASTGGGICAVSE